MMYKACSKCGKIHAPNIECTKRKIYRTGAALDTDAVRTRRTYKWREKRQEIRDNAHYLCELCIREGTINSRNLEVHHIVPIEEEPELAYDNENLICLCSMHHKKAESGEYSRDYLKEIAHSRENNPPVLK